MSPRGVTVPNIREQFFTALERVLRREGLSHLSSRAVTNEAGYAKGTLYNHFTDFDTFLAEFAMDRVGLIADEAEKLPARAGQGSVVENLADATAAAVGSSALAISGLLMSRPAMLDRFQDLTSDQDASLDRVQAAFVAYLDAERRLGRIDAAADIDTLALTIIGTVHHLFITTRVTGQRVCAIVRQLVGDLAADTDPKDTASS